MRRRVLWAAAGGGLFLVGLLVGLISSGSLRAFAQGGQTQTHAVSQPKQAYCDLYLTTLADKLGVSVSDVQQANAGDLTEVIDRAAADGKLTATQRTLLEQEVAKLRPGLCAQLNQLGKGHGAHLQGELSPVLARARETIEAA